MARSLLDRMRARRFTIGQRSGLSQEGARELPNSAVAADVALAALGTTQQNASRSADRVQGLD